MKDLTYVQITHTYGIEKYSRVGVAVHGISEILENAITQLTALDNENEYSNTDCKLFDDSRKQFNSIEIEKAEKYAVKLDNLVKHIDSLCDDFLESSKKLNTSFESEIENSLNSFKEEEK